MRLVLDSIQVDDIAIFGIPTNFAKRPLVRIDEPDLVFAGPSRRTGHVKFDLWAFRDRLLREFQ
jgi:hypothetical protein